MQHKPYIEKIIPLQDLPPLVSRLKQKGKTIATLNGSFDLLHAGHLYIIEEASKQADILIVGLNSDASIQQYKDPSRPIIPLEYRLHMVAALQWVDYVTSFEETTPHHLLSLIRPTVHVNGAEYAPRCVEQDTVEQFGGTVHYVEKIPGLSTSAIVEKIHAIHWNH